MRITDTSDLWWKTAVFYCLDVEKYLDDDGDGVGDLAGLAQRIDYLADLGVTCLWLLPFYPSPGLDDGYDVSDFYGVDPRLGSLGDLVEVIRTAKDRGIRVIADLVVNHTSDRHPWFLAAKRSVNSPYRDFYVWRDEEPDDDRVSMFPGEEEGVWQQDEKSGQFYLHSFYRHQPDLNMANPKVRDEIAKVIGFWLELGVNGFRVDSVPFLIDGPALDEVSDPHDYLRELRQFLQRRANDAIMLGEVNLPYAQQLEYFGGSGGPELTMQFDFPLMQRLFLALAREDPEPVVQTIQARPGVPREAQWVNFVRNHDELTLDQLSDGEREEVFAAFAPDESQRIFGRGIVRRLPPMLEGDPRRIRMVYSLIFSLPGSPALLYGEEIGMAENPDIPGRAAVRTPMQWSARRNGGFSAAAPSRLVAKPPEGGAAPEHVNVADQYNDEGSLLHFVRSLIARYRVSPEIGWGTFEHLPQEHAPALLVHTVTSELGRMLAIHNFTAEPATARIELDEPEATVLVDMFSSDAVALEDGRTRIEVDGYGCRWYRVSRPGDGRLA